MEAHIPRGSYHYRRYDRCNIYRRPNPREDPHPPAVSSFKNIDRLNIVERHSDSGVSIKDNARCEFFTSDKGDTIL